MAAAAEEVQFSLKIMMMKESSKVIYAEVDSDFADVLLSFLTLPLGTILRLLVKHYGDNTPTIGSLYSLSVGLLNLDRAHFWTEAGLKMLVLPRNSSEIECRRLKLQIDDTRPTHYFMCGNRTCVSMYYNVKCPCTTSTNMIRMDVESTVAQGGDKSVFTVHRASFLLTDDLCIMTNTSESLFRILKLNGIQDTRVLEERTLTFGPKEIMELLRGSLLSETPITDIILSNSSSAATRDKRKKISASVKYEPNALPHTQTSENIRSDCKKITVKVIVQKSTNRILLAQTRQDFVDFLFSFLTIPLGRIQYLLGNNTCFRSINSLYKSVSNLEIGEYMKSRITKTRLLEPQIPPYYLSDHQIFPLSQQNSPVICRLSENDSVKLFVSDTSAFRHDAKMKMIEPRGQHSFVKGPATFMVTESLQVSTASANFIISTLKEMGIPLSDVGEQELDIGIQEALSILKASLASTCALSEGLKPFLKRQPKQEK